jgi:hypothetical protein
MEDIKVCEKCGHSMKRHFFGCGCVDCDCMNFDEKHIPLFIGGVLITPEDDQKGKDEEESKEL